jgi:hypothetical protein
VPQTPLFVDESRQREENPLVISRKQRNACRPSSWSFKMSKTTRVKATLAICSAMLLLGASHAGFAQSTTGDGARREAIDLRIEELKERLELTPEQETRLAPIIEARNAKLRELRSSAGGDTSRRARMAALKQARKIQADFSAQIAPILTKEQQAEWEEIREEARAAAKERMRERR